MLFVKTPIIGVLILEQEKMADSRGFFARTFCRDELKKQNIDFNILQESTSFNAKKGTLRGMHFQKKPAEEQKIIRATSGRVFDVALDLRKDSGSYLQSFGLELSAENGKELFMPRGVAHGFLSLTDSAEVLYLIDTLYDPNSASGVRFDDPAFNIKWPGAPKIISEKDRAWPDYAK